MAWAFVAALVATLLLVGVAALILRGGDTSVVDEPASPTTSVEESDDLISVDSLTWSRINLGTQGPGLQIAAGGQGLVAVGVYHEPDPDDLEDGGGGPGWVQGYLERPTVWVSADGFEWSRVPEGEHAFFGEIADVAGGDDGFVAVAGPHVVPGRAWTSPDGITWSRVPTDTFSQTDLRGVIAGGPGFVAFGEAGPSNRAAIWTSPDGHTWKRVPTDPLVFSENANMHAMAVGGPGLVAAGFDEGTGNPVVWTSADAHTWSRVPHDSEVFGEGNPEEWPLARINDVASGGPGLVAVGSYMDRAAAWVSVDGVTWTRVGDDPAVFGAPSESSWSTMTGVTPIGDGLLAIGIRSEVAAAWTSRDGLTWNDITHDFDLTGNALMIEAVAGGPGVVILGEDLIEDYTDNRPPLIETVMWAGSPSQPAR